MYSDEEQEYDVEDPGEEFDQKQLEAAGGGAAAGGAAGSEKAAENNELKKQKTE